MGIPILVRQHLFIETAPWFFLTIFLLFQVYELYTDLWNMTVGLTNLLLALYWLWMNQILKELLSLWGVSGWIPIYFILQQPPIVHETSLAFSGSPPNFSKLEQLECLHSGNTLRRLMITHTIESYWIPSHIGSQVKRWQSQSYKFKEFAKISHLLKLLDKMCKYEMDPMSIVEDTERTRNQYTPLSTSLKRGV